MLKLSKKSAGLLSVMAREKIISLISFLSSSGAAARAGTTGGGTLMGTGISSAATASC